MLRLVARAAPDDGPSAPAAQELAENSQRRMGDGGRGRLCRAHRQPRRVPEVLH